MPQTTGRTTPVSVPATAANPAPVPAPALSTATPATPAPAAADARTNRIPEGLWLRCPSCSAMIYRKQMEANRHVCPECSHHFRISAAERVKQLADEGSFEPMFTGLMTTDPLGFTDLKSYKDRLSAEQKKTGQREGIQTGKCFIKGRPAMIGCLDLTFFMGTLSSVVGEKLTRAIEFATEEDLPLVVVSCSGGARMQESGYSLMQMAKTSAALARHADAGGLYISVLTDPTTGGVSASFAMLGDVIFAEPKALIGFAGPRVIAQTLRQELPEGFQTSEFLLKGGMVDRVVHRHELRNEIARVIDYTGK